MTIVILLTLFVLFIFSVWLQSIVRKKSQISSSSFQDYSIEVADYSNNLKFYKFLSSKNTDLHNKFNNLTTLIRTTKQGLPNQCISKCIYSNFNNFDRIIFSI